MQLKRSSAALVLVLLPAGCAPGEEGPDAGAISDGGTAPDAGPWNEFAPNALDIARVEAGLDAIELMRSEFSWWGEVDTCLSLFNATTQWLLGCVEPDLSQFGRVPGRQFRGRPIYRSDAPVLVAGVRQPFGSGVEQTVGFAAAYRPDEAGRDQYADQPWIFVQTVESVNENIPFFEAAFTTEQWLSVVVHEAFHVPQITHASHLDHFAAHIDDPNPRTVLAGLGQDSSYRAAVEAEFAVLQVAAADPDTDEVSALAALADWHAVWEQRLDTYGAAFPAGDMGEVEGALIYTEGTARFVENLYATTAGFHVGLEALADDPSFHGFADVEGEMYHLPFYDSLHNPFYFYQLGFHISLLLEHVDPTWRDTVQTRAGWLVGEVEARLP